MKGKLRIRLLGNKKNKVVWRGSLHDSDTWTRRKVPKLAGSRCLLLYVKFVGFAPSKIRHHSSLRNATQEKRKYIIVIICNSGKFECMMRMLGHAHANSHPHYPSFFTFPRLLSRAFLFTSLPHFPNLNPNPFL